MYCIAQIKNRKQYIGLFSYEHTGEYELRTRKVTNTNVYPDKALRLPKYFNNRNPKAVCFSLLFMDVLDLTKEDKINLYKKALRYDSKRV